MTKQELLNDVAKQIDKMIDNVDPYSRLGGFFRFCCNGVPFEVAVYNVKYDLLNWEIPRNKWIGEIATQIWGSVDSQWEGMKYNDDRPFEYNRMTREEAKEKGFYWYDHEFQGDKRIIFA